MKPSKKKRGKGQPELERSFVRRLSANRTDLLLALLLVVMVVVAYYPAFHAGFIWDDDDYVTENPLLIAPDGLWRIWFSVDSPSQYFPLVYTTFRFEYSLWGLQPFGYHAVNIFMHAANAILVWVLLSRLAIPGAWFAAAIWAVHPVQVESVAWITERKNVLSTLFFILSLMSYNAFVDRLRPMSRRYATALGFYALALFAKTTAVTMPVVMVILLWWKKHRMKPKRIHQVAPFVVMGVVMGLVTMWWEKVHQGTSGEVFAFTPVERLLIASRAVWFYLGKLVLPRDLAFSYPQWDIQPSQPLQYVPVLAVVAVAAALVKLRHRAKGTIAASGFFVLVLAPMLGIFSLWTFRYTYVADHYQYLACLGPIAWFAAATTRIQRKNIRNALVCAVLGVLCLLSFQYTTVFKDSESIWRDVLAKNPRSFMAYNNLGKILYDRGEREEGISLIEKAIEIHPANSEAHLNLGVVLYAKGDVDEAIRHFELAVEHLPQYQRAHRELCVALTEKGELDRAIEHGRIAVKLEPKNAYARVSLGSALAKAERLGEALECFREAVRLAPNLAVTHQNLGNALMQSGSLREAIPAYEQALLIEPTLEAARVNLAVLLYLTHDYAGAWQQVREGRKLGHRFHPDFIESLSREMPDPGY